MSQSEPSSKNVMQRFLDIVEKVGNKVPHPAVIFVALTQRSLIRGLTLGAAK